MGTRPWASKASPRRRRCRSSPSTNTSPTGRRVLVAFEVGQGEALAIVESAFVAESNWRLAVRAGIAALFDFLASEQIVAHIALLDALIATEHTAAWTRSRRCSRPVWSRPAGRRPRRIEAIGGSWKLFCCTTRWPAGSTSCPRRSRRPPTWRSRRFSAARSGYTHRDRAPAREARHGGLPDRRPGRRAPTQQASAPPARRLSRAFERDDAPPRLHGVAHGASGASW